MIPLTGKVIVITGAARGVGEALAREVARAGATPVLLGLEPELLARVAGETRGSAHPCDVTDGAALARVSQEVLARYGRVDVLVANAGIASGGPLLLAEAEAYDRTIEVNLLGSVRTLRAFLPTLVASRGYFLQIASVAAITPAPLMSAYCASKSGVEAFAHAVRIELRHHRVEVGVAYLSWTDTDMVRGADSQAGLGEMRSRLPGPFGRTYPLAPAVARLADGIGRRSPHIYAPGWLRLLPAVRGALPGLTARVAGRDAALGEELLRRAGPGATRTVGAGGAADEAARHQPPGFPPPGE